ncbi:MAG TPA: histidine kinase dimerization/phospho-acceptor domain-containing protein [Candidatus Sulfotelmatobacter sp.]
MSLRIKLWSAAVVACLAALVVAALLLRQSFQLTAFSDIIQCLLLFSGTLSFLTRAHSAKGRMRLFWSLMTLGLALWLFYQFLWTYFEVFLRADVPDIFSGDIILFIHIVPLIAALALRPHVSRDQYAARLGHLDFALLFVWWVYLYVLLVMAWQYAMPDKGHYNDNLNAVYLVEKIFFLAALAFSWTHCKGRWRSFYANLFAASLLYATSSYIANWAISRSVYYSGSLYDIPLVASMAWMTLIGLWNRTDESETLNARTSTAYGVWVARCGMIAAFSLPLFAGKTLWDASLPPRVRSFRIVLSLGAALVLGVMVFARQRLLDCELNRLLNDSRESFENLKRLQAQILQSEKMASIGQLVGGAAHELNNPITAMLGYSDLLLGTELSPEQQTLAAQISHHTRKTKSLVASLLSFARSAPASKSPVDLNTLARTAVKLTEPQWQAMKIEVATDFCPDLPKVLGDSNQLLQVCLQLLSNSLHLVHERSGIKLTLITETVAGSCVLAIGQRIARGEDPASPIVKVAPAADAIDPLGLTACRGIVHEHQGKISSQRCPDGTFTIRLELPSLVAVPGKVTGTKLPVLWQSRPFA